MSYRKQKGFKGQQRAKKPRAVVWSEGWDNVWSQCEKAVAKVVNKLEEGEKWEDPNFDVVNNTLYCLYLDPEKRFKESFKAVDSKLAGWKRPEEIFDNPQLFVDKATADDVQQGAIGNCWFLSACSMVAAVSPKLIKNLFAAYDEQAGVYGILFFINGEWTYVLVDDLLPVSSSGSPLFARSVGEELWVMLLEKAFAKLHGSYESIVGGYENLAMEDLTGGVGINHPSNSGDCIAFEALVKRIAKGYIFGCSTPSTFATGDGGNGLVGGHAYGILDAVEVAGLQLVKVRNPWGRDGEWKGDWSDNSKLWAAHPEVASACGFFGGKNDGIFWMTWKDLKKYFSVSIFECMLFRDHWSMLASYTTFYPNESEDAFDHIIDLGDEGDVNVVVVLCQEDTRVRDGKESFPSQIGFEIYEANEDYSPGELVAKVSTTTPGRSAVHQMIEGHHSGLYLIRPLVSKLDAESLELCVRVYANQEVSLFNVNYDEEEEGEEEEEEDGEKEGEKGGDEDYDDEEDY